MPTKTGEGSSMTLPCECGLRPKRLSGFGTAKVGAAPSSVPGLPAQGGRGLNPHLQPRRLRSGGQLRHTRRSVARSSDRPPLGGLGATGWCSRPVREGGPEHLLSRKPHDDAAVELGEGDHGVRAAARPHSSLGSVLNPSPMSKFDILFAQPVSRGDRGDRCDCEGKRALGVGPRGRQGVTDPEWPHDPVAPCPTNWSPQNRESLLVVTPDTPVSPAK